MTALPIEQQIEILKRHVTEQRLTRMLEVLNKRSDQFTVVFQEINHPHNVAAMLRSIEAFGLQDAHLITDDERTLVSADISRGSHRWLTTHRHASCQSCISELKAKGYALAIATPDAKQSINELDAGQPMAFIMGNERDGVADALRQAATVSFSIPMRGYVESFNVSVSLGIILHTLMEKALRNQTLAPLTEDRRQSLLYDWLCGSVYASEQILEEAAKKPL